MFPSIQTAGSGLFFVCIAVYLYGDLAIFGAAVGKSLRDASCTYWPPDAACNETLNGTVACWPGVDLSRDDAYRLLLSAFVLTVGSLGFFNVQKTMLLQVSHSSLEPPRFYRHFSIPSLIIKMRYEEKTETVAIGWSRFSITPLLRNFVFQFLVPFFVRIYPVECSQHANN